MLNEIFKAIHETIKPKSITDWIFRIAGAMLLILALAGKCLIITLDGFVLIAVAIVLLIARTGVDTKWLKRLFSKRK